MIVCGLWAVFSVSLQLDNLIRLTICGDIPLFNCFFVGEPMMTQHAGLVMLCNFPGVRSSISKETFSVVIFQGRVPPLVPRIIICKRKLAILCDGSKLFSIPDGGRSKDHSCQIILIEPVFFW